MNLESKTKEYFVVSFETCSECKGEGTNQIEKGIINTYYKTIRCGRCNGRGKSQDITPLKDALLDLTGQGVI